MSLSTNNELISDSFPVWNIRGINTNREIYNPENYINYNWGSEVPVYILQSMFTWDNGLSKYIPEVTPKTYTLKFYNEVPIKAFNSKFYSCFKELGNLKKATITGTDYYVGKGIITDSGGNPLIMLTYQLNPLEEANDPINYPILFNKLENNRLSLYLSRRIFSSEFAFSNKKLFKELTTVILPSFTKWAIPIKIKDTLDMLQRTYVDSTLNKQDLSNRFPQDYERAKREIIRTLS